MESEDVSKLKSEIEDFFQKPFDSLLFDPNNNPYVYISIISTVGHQGKEESTGSFVIPKNGLTSHTYDLMQCIAFTKALQAAHINNSDDYPRPVQTNDGYCSSFFLEDSKTQVIIAVIASPQDSYYVYDLVRNQVDIFAKTQAKKD